MKTIFTRWFMLSACAALSAMPVWADIPSASGACLADTIETTPSSDFRLLEGGTVVRHEATRLEWRRCPEGMAWSGSNCYVDGSTTKMTWHAALLHADNEIGWRIPNIRELRSIVERCRGSHDTHLIISLAINQQVFPNTPVSTFWSASPSASDSSKAWGVWFGNGGDGISNKANSHYVRLVRDGQ